MKENFTFKFLWKQIIFLMGEIEGDSKIELL